MGMATLTFYRQARADGGLRTGIEIDGETLLEDYLPGGQEHDPALLWYVDLRCEGDSLPTEPEAVREWFLENARLIQSGFATCAEELKVGVDSFDQDFRPYERRIGQTPDGTVLRVCVSAVRRMDARKIAVELRRIGAEWDRSLHALPSLASV
jgi:hypothetical protein